MIHTRFLLLAALSAIMVSCSSPGGDFTTPRSASGNVQKISGVKTTAYTHTESDHVKYATASAAGTTLKYGPVRSAAADWSVYPVGTVFQIEGESVVYQIDDYGSALVGTNTIDLYRPSKQSMNEWGARNVNIKVIQWGSSSQSMAIMKDRQKKSSRVKQMVQRLESSSSHAAS